MAWRQGGGERRARTGEAGKGKWGVWGQWGAMDWWKEQVRTTYVGLRGLSGAWERGVRRGGRREGAAGRRDSELQLRSRDGSALEGKRRELEEGDEEGEMRGESIIRNNTLSSTLRSCSRRTALATTHTRTHTARIHARNHMQPTKRTSSSSSWACARVSGM